MPILRRRCAECGREYELLRIGRSISALDRDDIEDLSCPTCSSLSCGNVIGAVTGTGLGGEAGHGRFFPRWDNGLGCRVSSNAHRKRIMKERGLIAYDGGDIDYERIGRQQRERRQKVRDDYQQVQDDYDNRPEFADYRRLRDKGAIDDIIEERGHGPQGGS